MDSQRLRDCLDADFRRLHEVARATDLHAAVPTCPGWTLADLVRHVGEVYLYKVEMMRLDGHADKWPPEGFNDEPPMDLLGRAYAALIAEFASRRPNDHTFTWYEPDQTVGFWIRDMAQEAVIHRVDAELAAAKPIVAIPGDLAADGIDELLVAFVQYDVALRPDKFAGLLGSAGDRSVGVTTPARSWGIEMTDSACAWTSSPRTARMRQFGVQRLMCCSGYGTEAVMGSRPRGMPRRSRCYAEL